MPHFSGYVLTPISYFERDFLFSIVPIVYEIVVQLHQIPTDIQGSKVALLYDSF